MLAAPQRLVTPRQKDRGHLTVRAPTAGVFVGDHRIGPMPCAGASLLRRWAGHKTRWLLRVAGPGEAATDATRTWRRGHEAPSGGDCCSSIDSMADARFARYGSSSQAPPVGRWWSSWASGRGIARAA